MAVGKQKVLDELDKSYSELTDAVESVDEAKADESWYGKWNVKEVLAHLIGWDREMTGALKRLAAGERPVPEGVDYNDADPWNDRFAAEFGKGRWQEMKTQLGEAHGGFRSALEAIDEERFAEGKTAFRIAYTTGIEHYREHAPAIRQWAVGG
jgi:hypothetical protein